MNKFHINYFFSILCIFCTANCIAKSVSTTVIIAYSGSNVIQRMLGACPLYTLYPLAKAGGCQRSIGWLPLCTLYPLPIPGWHPRVVRGYYHVAGWGPPDTGWQQNLVCSPLLIDDRIHPVININLRNSNSLIHYTGAVPP